MGDSLYAERDVLALRQHYCRHVDAMTREGLHDKADIAAELAWRDAEIERLGIQNRLRQRAVDRWVPCPDHRDKTEDGKCYVCENERLQRKVSADGHPVVDEQMVDFVGSALYIYWHDVNEQARNAYRNKVRTALIAAEIDRLRRAGANSPEPL